MEIKWLERVQNSRQSCLMMTVGDRLSESNTKTAQQLDGLCEIAIRMFKADAATILLNQASVTRIIASYGLPIKIRSVARDLKDVPYKIDQTYIVTDISKNIFAKWVFHEFGLGQSGNLIRLPVHIGSDYVVSLVVVGLKPLAKRPHQKPKQCGELIGLIRAEFNIVAHLLTNPSTDVTVAHTLDDRKQAVANSPVAAALLDAKLRFVAVNKIVTDTLGISAQKIIGKTHQETAPHVANSIDNILNHALQTMQSLPDFEFIGEVPEGHNRVLRYNVTPFSPIDTRDYFLLVTTTDITKLSTLSNKLSKAIGEDKARPVPQDPSQLFLLDTLVKRRVIRQRKSMSYLTLRSWRQPIREYQIKALKALKQNIPPELPVTIAKEIAAEVESFIGKSAFKAIVPVPCGHSKDGSCLSVELARALAAEFNLPVIQAFLQEPMSGVSHPKENTKRPAMTLTRIISEPVLLIDDVATSGAHLEEATLLLKPTCGSVMSVAWIGGDASDKN